MKEGKIVLGVLAGIATGALLGILFAPDKGCNTRKKIVHKGEDYVEEVKDKFNGMLDTLSEKYDHLKEEAESLVAKGKVKYDDA